MAAVLRRAWAPAVVAVVIIGGWELAVHVFDIQPLILPAPSDIVEAFRDDWTAIARRAAARSPRSCSG